jgi:hypothetical protein
LENNFITGVCLPVDGGRTLGETGKKASAKMNDRNESLRFTLRNLLVVTGLLAASLSVGHWTDSPLWSVHFTLLVVGWVLYRFLHGSLAGIIPCLLGADLLTIGAIVWAYRAIEPFLESIVYVFASVLILIGIGIFIGVANRTTPYWRWQIFCAAIFFTLLVGWWVLVPMIGEHVVAQRRARDTVRNDAAMLQAVAQVEAIRSVLGRAPTDSEFRELSKAPLPTIHWDGRKIEMRYRQVGDKEYWLEYYNWDIYLYHNTESKRGWFREPF